MLILRVETPSGEGAYNRHRSGYSAVTAHDSAGCPLTDRHPGPFSDTKLALQFDMILDNTHRTISASNGRFGFSTIDQYFNWFHTYKLRQALDRYGFRLSVYYVPDTHVAEGNAQCVFCIHAAVLVTRLDCETCRETIESALKDARVYEIVDAAE